MPISSGQFIGTYEVIAPLGHGGMATVYRARQVLEGGISREVAVKVITADPGWDPDLKVRFDREAATLIGLTHPHILKAFDYGLHADTPYLVMELMRGGSLAGVLRRGSLGTDQVIHYMEQISAALDYAHQQGIIHRDLKPENILLDEAGNCYLADFGIVKLLTDNATGSTSGQMVGTPQYMAPEQMTGDSIDARADLYALGIMLFEMLSGHLPFTGDTPVVVLHKHLFEAPPPLTRYRPELPAVVNQVLAKALSKTPGERYQSAVELTAALQAVLAESFATTLPLREHSPAAASDDTDTTLIGLEDKPAAFPPKPAAKTAVDIAADRTPPSQVPKRQALLTRAGLTGIFLLLVAITGFVGYSLLHPASGSVERGAQLPTLSAVQFLHLAAFNQPEGVTAVAVQKAADKTYLWIGTNADPTHALYRLDISSGLNGALQAMPITLNTADPDVSANPPPALYISQIAVDPNGNVWVLVRNHGIVVYPASDTPGSAPGAFTWLNKNTPGSTLPKLTVSAVAFRRDPAAANTVNAWLAAGAEVHTLSYSGSYPTAATITFVPSSGNNDPVYRASARLFESGGSTAGGIGGQTPRPSSNDIQLLSYVTETQTLWAALGTQLVSIPVNNSALPPETVALPEPITALAAFPDLTWWGGVHGRVYAFSATTPTPQPYGVDISVLHMVPDAVHPWLWLGNDCAGSPEAVCRVIGLFDRSTHQFVAGPSLNFSSVHSMAVGPDGTLWLGTEQGVYYLPPTG